MFSSSCLCRFIASIKFQSSLHVSSYLCLSSSQLIISPQVFTKSRRMSSTFFLLLLFSGRRRYQSPVTTPSHRNHYRARGKGGSLLCFSTFYVGRRGGGVTCSDDWPHSGVTLAGSYQCLAIFWSTAKPKTQQWCFTWASARSYLFLRAATRYLWPSLPFFVYVLLSK